jgi:Tol biopolymer transport system component
MNVQCRIVTLAFCLLTAGAAHGEQAPRKLTHPRFSYPTWSPDGSRILYESSVTGNWEIYIMDLEGISDNGGNVTRLTDNDHLDRLPSWSPDGQFIAFISDRDGDFEVFRMRPDGSEQTQLTHNDVNEIHPYWTPDSRRIIFNSQVKGKRLYAIWIMNRDGTGSEELLRDDDLNSYAQMSPDGELIVFDKWQDNNENNGEIYVLETKTGKLRRLTRNQDVYDGYPTWSPDGQWIVYASEVGDDFKLFSIRPDGSGRRQLTFGPGSDARPAVSPDGTRLLFNREVEDDINILTTSFPAASGE